MDKNRRNVTSTTSMFESEDPRFFSTADGVKKAINRSVSRLSLDKDKTPKKPFDNTTMLNSNKFLKSYKTPISYKQEKAARNAKNYNRYIRYNENLKREFSTSNDKRYHSMSQADL